MNPDEKSSRRFTPEEINDILRRALERQTPSTGVTYNELLETAHELGIDPAALDGAIEEQMRRGSADAARTQWVKLRKQKFFSHLRSYAIINTFLFVLWFLTGSHHLWFLFPLFGWGVGIAFDAADTFFPHDRKVDRGAMRLLARQQMEEAKRRKEKVKDVKRVSFDHRARKVIIEKGDKRIEIG